MNIGIIKFNKGVISLTPTVMRKVNMTPVAASDNTYSAIRQE